MPSPPRVVVPPPILCDPGDDELELKPHPSSTFSASDSAALDFLAQVTYGDFFAANGLLDWRYESRRQAQKILPFLYLGPVGAARDRDFLQREGITLLLAVRNTMSAQARLLEGSKIASELGIKSEAVDVAGNQELIAAFPHAIQIINTHLSEVYSRRIFDASLNNHNKGPPDEKFLSMGKVLVYCESGNERSAGVVAAYMMAMYDMTLVKAIQIIQAQRFCSAFDDSLKDLLSTFSDILDAKRNVMLSINERTPTQDGSAAALGVTGDAVNAAKSKRKFEDAYDMDVEMDETMDQLDAGRFDGRDGFAPFQDAAVL